MNRKLIPFIFFLFIIGSVSAQGMSEVQTELYSTYRNKDIRVNTWCTAKEETSSIDYTKRDFDPYFLFKTDGTSFRVLRKDGSGPDIYVVEGMDLKAGGCPIYITMPSGWVAEIKMPPPSGGIGDLMILGEPIFKTTSDTDGWIEGKFMITDDGDYFILLSDGSDVDSQKQSVYYVKARGFTEGIDYDGSSGQPKTQSISLILKTKDSIILKRVKGNFIVNDGQKLTIRADGLSSDGWIEYGGSKVGSDGKITMDKEDSVIQVKDGKGEVLITEDILFDSGFFWNKTIWGHKLKLWEILAGIVILLIAARVMRKSG